MTPASLAALLDLTASRSRDADVSDATPYELEQLAQGCNAVAFQVEGLRERIARAGKNGTPQPLPTKPLHPKPKQNPPPQNPPPKKDDDGKKGGK